MPDKTLQIIRLLADRIVNAFPRHAVLGADDLADFSVKTTEWLLQSGLLRKNGRLKAVICDGCEWQCSKPIQVQTETRTKERWAFIDCDEEPDLGRIPISSERLIRYEASLEQMAHWLSRELGSINLLQRIAPDSFLVGDLKGRHGKRQIRLVLGRRQIELFVGDHSANLVEFVRADENTLLVHHSQLRRYANRKRTKRRELNQYPQNRDRQRTKRQKRISEDKALIVEAKRLRHQTGASWSEIARQLAVFDLAVRSTGKRLSAERIRRILSGAGSP